MVRSCPNCNYKIPLIKQYRLFFVGSPIHCISCGLKIGNKRTGASHYLHVILQIIFYIFLYLVGIMIYNEDNYFIVLFIALSGLFLIFIFYKLFCTVVIKNSE